MPAATPQTAARSTRSQSPPRLVQRSPVSAIAQTIATSSVIPYMWIDSGPMSMVPVDGEGKRGEEARHRAAFCRVFVSQAGFREGSWPPAHAGSRARRARGRSGGRPRCARPARRPTSGSYPALSSSHARQAVTRSDSVSRSSSMLVAFVTTGTSVRPHPFGFPPSRGGVTGRCARCRGPAPSSSRPSSRSVEPSCSQRRTFPESLGSPNGSETTCCPPPRCPAARPLRRAPHAGRTGRTSRFHRRSSR